MRKYIYIHTHTHRSTTTVVHSHIQMTHQDKPTPESTVVTNITDND